jgi:dipeptidyl aminopeptidase/acylaminoacyl peptidase
MRRNGAALARDRQGGLAAELVAAWGCWGPTLTYDGRRMAFVSDRNGSPELWIQDLDPVGLEPARVVLSEDPVVEAKWSPDGRWLAASVATGGGVRTEVWVVRPDGGGARRVAGGDQHAELGAWARVGHRLIVTLCGDLPGQPNRCVLIDPEAGEQEPIADGDLVHVLDLSPDSEFALIRDGTRGAQFCRVLDRRADRDYPLLPFPGTGSTDLGLLRPALPDDAATLVAYVVTDAGQARRSLLAVPIDEHGRRGEAGILAGRDDADLELADADAAGRRVLLIWNTEGRSDVDVLDTATGRRCRYGDLPGEVVANGVLSRDGSIAVLSVEGPLCPRRLWKLDLGCSEWSPLSPATLHTENLVTPTLERFEAQDGLPLTGWLYRPRPGVRSLERAGGRHEAPPAVVSLHGGPEAQERPVFSPLHQALVAAGMVVFAPNIRGSFGFGRAFVHADDRYGRLDAIADVVSSAGYLVGRGYADPRRLAVTGRSYGGYATLMALVHHPGVFTAGVDVCGMSDLLTFFRDSEPWIARAAVTKYGDPDRDAALLAQLSPLPHAESIHVPLLVVHGEHDTNVPISEALQIVAALRALGRDVDYLELEGEGHEFRRASSRLRLLEAVTSFLSGVLSARERERQEH